MQHQYHYPNLESVEAESLLERVRTGGGSAVGQSAFRNRLLAQHHALLDPPLLQQPYVNNTLDEEDEEGLDVDGFSRMGRRGNSLESIQHAFRHGMFLVEELE